MPPRLRLSVRVLPWDIPKQNDFESGVQVQQQFRPFLIPCSTTDTVEDLRHQIAARFQRRFPSEGALHIECLETYNGDVLDDDLELGDCFDDRGTSDQSNWTVCVRREPPSLEELKLLGNTRLSSVVDGSSARPPKRSHADISSYPTENDERQDRYRPLKRQREEQISALRAPCSEQPIASSEVDNIGYFQRPPSIFGQLSAPSGEDLQRSRQQTSYNTPQSIPAESPTTDLARVPSASGTNGLPLASALPSADSYAQHIASNTDYDPRIGPSGNGWITPAAQRSKSPAPAPFSGDPAVDQPADLRRLGVLGTNDTLSRAHTQDHIAAETPIKESASQATGEPTRTTQTGTSNGIQVSSTSSKGLTNGADKPKAKRKSNKTLNSQSPTPNPSLAASKASRTDKIQSAPNDDALSTSAHRLTNSPDVDMESGINVENDKATKQLPSSKPVEDKMKQESQIVADRSQKSPQKSQAKEGANETGSKKTPAKKVNLAKIIASEQEEIQKLSHGLSTTPRQIRPLTPHVPGRTAFRKRADSRPASSTPSKYRQSSLNRNGQAQTPAKLVAESEQQHKPLPKNTQSKSAQQSSKVNASTSTKHSAQSERALSLPETGEAEDAEANRENLVPVADVVTLRPSPTPAAATKKQQDGNEQPSKKRSRADTGKNDKAVVGTHSMNGRQPRVSPDEPSQESESIQVDGSQELIEEEDDSERDHNQATTMAGHVQSSSKGNDVGLDLKTPGKSDAAKSQTLVPTSPILPNAERRKSPSTSYSRSPARVVTKTPDPASASDSDSGDSSDDSSNSQTGSESESGSDSSHESDSEDEGSSKRGSGTGSETSSGADDSDNDTAKSKVERPKNTKARQATKEASTPPESPSKIDAKQAESQLQFESSAPLFVPGPGMSQLVSQSLDYTQDTQPTIGKPSMSRPSYLSKSKYPSLSEMKNSSQNLTPIEKPQLPPYKMPANQKRPLVGGLPFESSSEEESGSDDDEDDDDEDLDASKTPTKGEDKFGSSQRSAGKNQSGFMDLIRHSQKSKGR